MTRIHLVRHGQTDWNLERRIQGQTNSQLTELGRQQAKDAGKLLREIPFNTAYASSSDRARETAQIILQRREIPLNLLDELREIALGPWEGKLYAEIKAEDEEGHSHFWEDPSKFNRDGAETFYQLQERALNAMEKIARAHPGEDVLVVSHGAFIKSILCHIENRHLSQFWLPPTMSNCCHSIIRHVDGQTYDIEQYAGLTSW